MQLSAEQVQELRARLANRKSFFGGALGSASASAAASYVPASQQEPPPEPAQPQGKKARRSDALQPGNALPSKAAAPQPRKATAADYAAFAALTQDTPPPQARPAAAAAKPSAASRAAPASRTPTPPPRAAQAGPRPTPPKGPTPPPRPQLQGRAGVRVTHGRSKKGQAMRSSAVAPQAVGGLTQSQRASQAWAAQAQLHRNSAATEAARGSAPAAGDAARRASGAAASSSAPARALPGQQQASERGGQWQQQQQQQQQPAALSSLQGKDLSRLPEWQRTILEKKLQAEGRKRRLREQEGDLEGFVVSDEEGDWRKELRSITGYDASRFQNEGDDRSMEADWRTIQAEERRSARAGRSEDDRAEAEEAARQRAKAKRRRAA